MKNLISLANSLQFRKFTKELLNEECQYDPSAYTEKLMRNKRLLNLTYDGMISQYSCDVKEVRQKQFFEN